MDRFLLAITFFNYIGGISIEKYFLHENNYFGTAIVAFPFLWFGFIIVILRTKAAISHDLKSDSNPRKEKLIPNIILMILNAIFPIVGLMFLGSK